MPSRGQVIPVPEADASGTAVEATGDGVRSARHGGDRPGERLAWVALGATLLPLVVAAGRAGSRGWGPVGDAATIGIRARGVLGGGGLPPLGPATTSSWTSGIYH